MAIQLELRLLYLFGYHLVVQGVAELGRQRLFLVLGSRELVFGSETAWLHLFLQLFRVN